MGFICGSSSGDGSSCLRSCLRAKQENPLLYSTLLSFSTLTICSSSVMGMLLLLLVPLPGVGELCEAPDDEWDEDTVDEEDRDVAQLPWPLVLLRGGVGGGTGPASVEQSLELRLGDKREGKLNVLVHCAKLRTIVCVRRLKLIPKCFKLLLFSFFLVCLCTLVYCVFSLSLAVSCTHHKFWFYIWSISQFCTNISKLLTQLAQRTRNLLEFDFFISQTQIDRESAERTKNEPYASLARKQLNRRSRWARDQPAGLNPHTQLRSRPAGRSRQCRLGSTTTAGETVVQARANNSLDSSRLHFRARQQQQQRRRSSSTWGRVSHACACVWVRAELLCVAQFVMLSDI